MRKDAMLPFYILVFILFSTGSCDSSSEAGSPEAEQDDNTTYTYQKAFPNLSFTRPVELALFPNKNKFIVLEQGGKIFSISIDFNTEEKLELADIDELITSRGNEQGLLGFAFDPNFGTNSYIYLNYTAASPSRTVIARFSFDQSANSIDLNSKLVILEFSQPYSNHNGGKIAFGADNFLYISAGDGGSGGDPQGYAQNGKSMLGKILRIDVSQASASEPYKIPTSNPFVNDTTVLNEIYALGLRNVWKFSFDTETNRLWAADVGQVTREEINIIQSGKNYGWNFREGFLPYNGSNEGKAQFEDPVYDYPRSEGFSVTGGYVYRGKYLTKLRGHYLYADFGTGKIWAIDYTNNIASNRLLLETAGKNIASFAVDSIGEHYFSAFDGNIYKIVEAD
jgi:glucose/arabinose dehydrogenase